MIQQVWWTLFLTHSHNFSSALLNRRTTWRGPDHLSHSPIVRLCFLIHPRDQRVPEDSTSVLQPHIRLHFMSHTTTHVPFQRDQRDLPGLTENREINIGKHRKIGLLAETEETSSGQPNLLDCAVIKHNLRVLLLNRSLCEGSVVSIWSKWMWSLIELANNTISFEIIRSFYLANLLNKFI